MQAAAQGNLAGGRSPAWHSGSPAELEAGGQRNPAALSGWKTKEFGGRGHNQLVFDDSPLQPRVQLATTQFASQLNLGHLVHQQDNHRGSFRGTGLELRTDAYGAVRGADQTPPIHAWPIAVSGMLRAGDYDAALADAQARAIAATDTQVPHTTDPVVTLTARAGIAATAGLDIALAASEGLQLAAGQDLEFTVGGAARIHTGQAIGILGGVATPGTEAAGTGLTLLTRQGDLTLHAHDGPMQVAASGTLTVQSQNGSTELASPKKVVLAVAGGASLVIEGGNITLQCPGTLTVKAATKSFVAAESSSYPMPALPRTPLPAETPFGFDLTPVRCCRPLGRRNSQHAMANRGRAR